MKSKALKVMAINCSIKPGSEASSTQVLLSQVLSAFEKLNASGKIYRTRDFTISPGVTSDEGPEDEWPKLRKLVTDCDILVIGTPVWMGQPSSETQRVFERLDAFLSETDSHGRMPSYSKVACIVVVGNEDGAHHISAICYQALNDVGFSLAPNAVSYWVGEAMQGVDYKDLESIPEEVENATDQMTRNAVHLARLLKEANYPGQPSES